MRPRRQVETPPGPTNVSIGVATAPETGPTAAWTRGNPLRARSVRPPPPFRQRGDAGDRREGGRDPPSFGCGRTGPSRRGTRGAGRTLLTGALGPPPADRRTWSPFVDYGTVGAIRLRSIQAIFSWRTVSSVRNPSVAPS